MFDIYKEYRWTNPETGLEELIDINVNSKEGKAWLENEGIDAVPTEEEEEEETPETGKTTDDATSATATSTTPAQSEGRVWSSFLNDYIDTKQQQEDTELESEDISSDSQDVTEVVEPTTEDMDESTRLMTTYKFKDENSEDFYNRVTPKVSKRTESDPEGRGQNVYTDITINGITRVDHDNLSRAGRIEMDSKYLFNGQEASDDQVQMFEELYRLNEIHNEASKIRSEHLGDYSELSDSEVIKLHGSKWDVHNRRKDLSEKLEKEIEVNNLDPNFNYDYQTHLEWEQQQYVDGFAKHSAAENAKINAQYKKERQGVANEILPGVQDQIQQKYSDRLKKIETDVVDGYNKRFDAFQKSTLAKYEKLAKKAKTQKEIDKINVDYQNELKAWWDKEQPNLQNDYTRLVNETYGDAMNKDLNSTLNNSEQIKALDESWQSKFQSTQDKILEDYKNNYKPESKHFSEEDFERISRELDKAGFDVADGEQKKYMLQKYLQELERVQGGTPEDIEEIKNEFWGHYYDKLEKTQAFDASGNPILGLTGQPTYQTSQFVLKDMAAATLKNAQEIFDREVKKYTKKRKSVGVGPAANMPGTFEEVTDFDQLWADNPGLKEALEYSKQVLDNPEAVHPSAVYNFFNGMASLEDHKYVPFAGGIIDLTDSLARKRLADKVASGEATELEKSALQMYLIKQQSDEQVRQLSTSYNAGAMAAESLPFMAEMVATSGAFNVTKQVVSKGIKKALTKGVDKVVRATMPMTKYAGGGISKGLRFKKGTDKMLFAPKNNTYKIVDNIGDALGGILGTVAQTTVNPQRYLAGTVDSMTPQMAWAYTNDADDLVGKLDVGFTVEGKGDSFPKAFAKNMGLAWSEYATERMGWLVPSLGKSGLKKLGITKSPEWLKRVALGTGLRKLGLHKTEALDYFVRNQMGWNGFLGEMSEEFMNIPLSNLISGNDITEGLDWQNIKEMGISIGASSLAFGGGTMLYNKAAGNKAPSYYVDNQRFENEKAAIAHLKKMKKDGTLNKNTDIEITNDFIAYDNASKILEEAGLSNDIIKTGGSGVSAGHIAAAEVEFMNELSQEDRNELESIDGEIRKQEADKQDANQRDNTNHKEVHAINENIKKLNRRRESILEPVKAKVQQLKTDVYNKKLANLREILGKDKYDEVVTEANNKTEVVSMMEQAVAESEGLTKQGDQWVNKEGEVVDISEAVESGLNKHGGFYVDENTGKKKIFINREASLGDKGNVDVASHEFLHYFLSETLHHHPELKLAFGKALQSHVFNIDPRQVRDTDFRNRLIGYQKRGEIVSAEETLNILSDAMANGTYQHNETALTKLGDIIRRVMSSFGVRVNFGSGRDVFNFIKDYNKEFEAGKLSKGMQATMEKGVKVSGQIQDLAKSEQKRLETDVKALNKGIRSIIPDWEDMSVQEAVDERMVFSESAQKKVPKESPLEAINKLLPKNIKTNKDYQDFTQNQREFPKLYAELMQPGGVINNYIRSRQTSKEEGDKMLDEAMMRLINFKPENKRKDGTPVGIEGFGEFIFANTRFAKLVAKKKLFEEGELAKKNISTDTEQAKQIEDTSTPIDQAPAKDDEAPIKTDVLKVSGVESKAEDIKKMVDIKEGEDIDFKGVTSKYGGKAAEMIFGVPASKITDPKKNLTYAKKIVDGIPEPSEAGNIQKFYTGKDNVRKFLKILKDSNVTSEQAHVSKIGESIDVAKGVTGRSIGLKGRALKYFFEPVITPKGTRARSKGLTSQVPLWRLKPKFRGKVSNEVIEEIQRDLGITPTGQLNKYDRSIGQLLKGVANYQANQTVLSAAQRNLEEARSKADVEGKKAIGEQIANITAAQSKLAFSEDFSEEQVKAATMNQNAVISTSKILKLAGLPNYLADRAAKALMKRPDGKEVKHINYDHIVAREAGKEGRADKTIGEEVARITQALHKMDPVYSTLFKIGMSNGWGRSFFGVNSKFDELSKIPKEELEALPPFLTRFMYHEKELLNPKRVVEENGEIYYIVGNLKKKGESKKLTAKEFLELDKQKLDFLEKMFEDIQKHLKKHPEDAWFFARWVTDASSNQSSIFRTSAPVIGFYYKDGKLHYNVKLREEHSTPQNNIGTMFLGAAINGESISDVGKVARASFVQLSLTHEHDDMLKAIKDKDGNIIRQSLEANMPDEYWNEVVPNILNGNLDWLDLGMAAMIRYARAGVNLNEYIIPGLGKTITEYFGVGVDMSKLNPKQVEALVEIQNDLISDILTGKITREAASDHIEASRKLDFKSSKDDIKALKNYKIAKGKINHSISSGENKKIVPDKKAILVVGASGSGKSTIIKKLGLRDQGFEVLNPDDALDAGVKKAGLSKDQNEYTREQSDKWRDLQYEASQSVSERKEKIRGRGKSVVVDSTGAKKIGVERSIREFKQAGYDVQIIFVDSSLETALARNKARSERVLTDTTVKNSYQATQANKKRFKELSTIEGKVDFVEINTDNLEQDQPLPKSFISKVDKFSEVRFDNDNSRGMSTFDFDETLIIGGENFVIATDPDTGHEVKISSEQWPVQGPELAAAGYKFDFSDFANVRGGKEGPLLQKMKNQIEKYGPNNVFILTARQQASAVPIHRWLKSKGINIPLRNITGLGKSEGSAKADWMLQKYAEGYNDMYFVDDAISNVKAVKDVLDRLDIKSKVVQAKINFSENGSDTFNEMLDRNAGVPKDKIFSDAQAKLRGKKVGGFKFFVPPSAEDFKGLLYNFLGKGKQGDADMAFFKEHLLDPFAKGIREINSTKQRTSEEYKELRKKMPDVAKSLNKKIPGSDYSVGDAIRVYLWSNNDIDIPGISEQEVSFLSDHVNGDGKLKAFADGLGKVSRSKDGYVKPDENWVVGSIASDLHEQTSKVNRAELLSEWKANRDIIFSPENMNKIEAVYGTDFRDALENMLFRMETGTNRITGKKDKVVNGFMDWINGSVGAVMFFNTRSAVLQTLSMVNFINWGDNNIFQAGKAFANQPQYWKDFLTLFNSDMLKQRRAGMAIDVNLAELSNAVSKASTKDKARAAIRYLLQIGFTPTQIADSFAIAAGGSTFYRNRINKYIKEGMSQKEAETQAFEDFQEIAEETQQSSRPDLISQQQAGALGRLVLAWQNTPMQYTRLTKKAISDLVNGRGDWRQHVSRILYYGAAQNIIFGSLQTGLAFLMFGGDEDEEKTKKKVTRVANGALDTLLRGTGVYGAMVSTLKNVIMKYADERKKPYGKRELSKVALEATQLSPPIGSKLRKIMSAIYSYEYNLGVPEKLGWNINNPILNVISSAVEGLTNAPLDRGVRKAQNLDEAINGNHEMWKRVALFLGWDKWGLNIKNEELEEARAKVKEEKAEKKKKENEAKKEEKKKLKEEEEKKEKERKEAEGIKEVRCSGTKSNGKRCNIKIETKEKTALCMYHKTYKDGEASDRDGDGIKEYRCEGITGSGKRCKNRTERENKRCYAHQ